MLVESVSDECCPEVPGVIRIEMFKVQKIMQDPSNQEDLLVTDYSNIDFKGYFPMRLMNMMIGSVIPKGIENMKQELLKIN